MPIAPEHVLLIAIFAPCALGVLAPFVGRLAPGLLLLGCVGTGAAAVLPYASGQVFEGLFLDTGGVAWRADALSGWFFATNALVTGAVLLYYVRKPEKARTYGILLLVHGALNALFVSVDLFTVYVVIELITLLSFLLIAQDGAPRRVWNGVRYLFINNLAMLLYLIGAIELYRHTGTFQIDAMAEATPTACAFLVTGLLVKGGVFVSGLWLPYAHAEADTPVSAILSGIIIKIGVYPLLRIAAANPELDAIIRLAGAASAAGGVLFAIFEKDAKRLLAFHTISQVGFMLAAPETGGYYACAHGLVKSCLFFCVGALPTRSMAQLKKDGINVGVWVPLVLASLSISGLPGFLGYSAKTAAFEYFLDIKFWLMSVAAAGTCVSFAKFVFVPVIRPPRLDTLPTASVALLLTALLGGGFALGPFSESDAGKAAIILVAGWLAYILVAQFLTIRMPRVIERFEHLAGVLAMVLLVVYWGIVW